jgi:hypothetical protein
MLGLYINHVRTKRLMLDIKTRIGDFINTENVRFKNMGVFWRVPADHVFWLELDLVFKDREETD